MRIFRYVSSGGGPQPRVAVASPSGPLVDLLAGWSNLSGSTPDNETANALLSTARVIAAGPQLWSQVSEVADAGGRTGAVVQNAFVRRWLAPLDNLSSLRDFLAFEDHVKRGAARRETDVPAYWYEAPVYYKGNHRSIIGPDDECRWPSYTDYLDFELELALVVGRRGRDVTPDEAPGHVFGFTVMNDFSARDIQRREMTAWLGPAKGKDFATGLGPCIVTADEIGTEPDLEMRCRVNGEEWGRARSGAMHWRWAEIIAHVSLGEDVYPGDVLGSGTPGGCCGLDIGRKLEPGDVVELDVEGIGVLRNTIGARVVPG